MVPREQHAADANPAPLDAAESRPAENEVSGGEESGTGENSARESGGLEIGTEEIGGAEICTGEIGAEETGAVESMGPDPGLDIYAGWVDLVERIRSSETDGLAELYLLFSKGIRFYLCRQLGPQELDDKVHDTFVVVVQAIRRGELREPQRLMGFVRTICAARWPPISIRWSTPGATRWIWNRRSASPTPEAIPRTPLSSASAMSYSNGFSRS